MRISKFNTILVNKLDGMIIPDVFLEERFIVRILIISLRLMSTP